MANFGGDTSSALDLLRKGLNGSKPCRFFHPIPIADIHRHLAPRTLVRDAVISVTRMPFL